MKQPDDTFSQSGYKRDAAIRALQNPNNPDAAIRDVLDPLLPIDGCRDWKELASLLHDYSVRSKYERVTESTTAKVVYRRIALLAQGTVIQWLKTEAPITLDIDPQCLSGDEELTKIFRDQIYSAIWDILSRMNAQRTNDGESLLARMFYGCAAYIRGHFSTFYDLSRLLSPNDVEVED